MRFFRTLLLMSCFFSFTFLANNFHAVYAASSVPSEQSAVMSTINQVFGKHAWGALQVARCESGLNPRAYNPSGATGLFQIMPSTWNGTPFQPYTWAKATNPWFNIQAAYAIFRQDGSRWQQWTCKPSRYYG